MPAMAVARAVNRVEPRIIGFMASAEHRCALLILSTMYKPHLQHLAFVNSYSATREASVISTRLLETPVENRNILAEAAALSNDWRLTLPWAARSMDKVILESTVKDIAASKQVLHQTICEAFNNNLEVSLKYLRDIDMEIGWSTVWVVDPIIAPWVPAAILEGLKQCQLFETNEYPMPLGQVRCVNDDNYSNTAIDTAVVWTIDSSTHAFPGMTFWSLYDSIVAKYTSNIVETRAVAVAYGLTDQRIIDDLCKLARDQLRISLQSAASAEYTWKIGVDVRHYFNSIFQEKFEYIYDSLDVKFLGFQ